MSKGIFLFLDEHCSMNQVIFQEFCTSLPTFHSLEKDLKTVFDNLLKLMHLDKNVKQGEKNLFLYELLYYMKLLSIFHYSYLSTFLLIYGFNFPCDEY